ncbi:putative DNA-binding protein with PD1-like motif [Variovorax sp. W1I1]|nr:putative DNA-binding protein with PD1-like motif [Variovorax sp. W1I1]
MTEKATALPRARTVVHPGPYRPVRIAHMHADQSRHFRLALPAGRTLHEALVQLLTTHDVASASMTLIDGELEQLSFCMALPDPTGRVLATYGAPETLRGARLIFGNATLGRSAAGSPIVHCHGAFCQADGRVRGGHILTERTVVGCIPVTAVVTALDSFELRVSYDEETRMPLMHPQAREATHV